jgi:predicted nucleic acid-binding Zn ribbon protein
MIKLKSFLFTFNTAPFMLNLSHQQSIVKLNRPFWKQLFIFKKTGFYGTDFKRMSKSVKITPSTCPDFFGSICAFFT